MLASVYPVFIMQYVLISPCGLFTLIIKCLCIGICHYPKLKMPSDWSSVFSHYCSQMMLVFIWMACQTQFASITCTWQAIKNSSCVAFIICFCVYNWILTLLSKPESPNAWLLTLFSACPSLLPTVFFCVVFFCQLIFPCGKAPKSLSAFLSN